ncbi:hypothetical protein ABES33_21170 [Bacillus pseudomycoides]|uniref:hypothetical protein n=1 Tax=Bacillus TaxID=1386 RepID=UPI000375EBA8|nr:MULTISPECIES: hypothetical protein [Bacillus]PEP48965.1 hypothetical protein CN564_26245 [Bacillus pseudomycoides]PGS04285.1 hypothetical protein COC54_14710 [Bacillus pseudomycoides]PHC92019.1 hypothetical protein COF36_22330 [Bacillus pseudomycoides]
MCALCNGMGIIRKETYPGVIETNGCNCEVAIQQQEVNQKRWEAWLVRFESMVQKIESDRNKKAS